MSNKIRAAVRRGSLLEEPSHSNRIPSRGFSASRFPSRVDRESGGRAISSPHERFWEHTNYAVVGRSSAKPFPRLTYNALKEAEGKTVFAVDPSCDEIDGDPAYAGFADLPGPVDAAVLEVPKEETASWVERAADAGITRIWIHMGRETPEALARAEERGLEVCSGTCAVQYLTGGFPHNIHRLLRKAAGRW